VYHYCDTEPQPRDGAPRPKVRGGHAADTSWRPRVVGAVGAPTAKGDALGRRTAGSPPDGIVGDRGGRSWLEGRKDGAGIGRFWPVRVPLMSLRAVARRRGNLADGRNGLRLLALSGGR